MEVFKDEDEEEDLVVMGALYTITHVEMKDTNHLSVHEEKDMCG
jgi:hypothetical protein